MMLEGWTRLVTGASRDIAQKFEERGTDLLLVDGNPGRMVGSVRTLALELAEGSSCVTGQGQGIGGGAAR
jgi:hypothetical protein